MNQDANQLTLSYELLYLMQWLVENEPEKLKALVALALRNGLQDKLKNINILTGQGMAEEMQYNIIDFLGLLEGFVHEVMNEQTMKYIKEKKLMPAIDHIDSKTCDDATVQFSIEKAHSKLDRNPESNPQELLFKELLRCWKPQKETTSN